MLWAWTMFSGSPEVTKEAGVAVVFGNGLFSHVEQVVLVWVQSVSVGANTAVEHALMGRLVRIGVARWEET